MPPRSSRQTLSDDALLAATGNDWATWFALLDAEGWSRPSHQQIVAVLTAHGVDGWWAQGIAVGYEQARGLRQPGQRRDGGFEATVSRTIAAEPEAALDALIAAVSSAVGQKPQRVSREIRYPTARFTLESGEQVLVGTKPPTRSGTPVSITWGKVSDAEAAEARRSRAKEILAGL